MMRSVSRLVVACVAAVTVACGQKGDPLPPLHLLPAAPVEATVRRRGAEARIRVTQTTTSLNGWGALVISQCEPPRYAAPASAAATRRSRIA